MNCVDIEKMKKLRNEMIEKAEKVVNLNDELEKNYEPKKETKLYKTIGDFLIAKQKYQAYPFTAYDIVNYGVDPLGAVPISDLSTICLCFQGNSYEIASPNYLPQFTYDWDSVVMYDDAYVEEALKIKLGNLD